MKTPNGSENAENGDKPLPNSKKVYVSGTLHQDIRVPFREISLAPTKTMSGEIRSERTGARVRHERPMG